MRSDGDLTRYYDELDRIQAEKLRQKALARERRGVVFKTVVAVFVWVSIFITLPLWLIVGAVRWLMGRKPLYDSLADYYGRDFVTSAIVGSIIAYVIVICASTVIYVKSTRSYCEQNRGSLACMQLDIDKQQQQLDKLRSEQDK